MSENPTLHFFCGKAGAGKTTLATQLARDGKAILISEDIWLMRLYGDQMTSFDDYIKFSRKLKTVVGPLVIDLLRAKQSVVMDFQANTSAGRNWFRSIIQEAGAAHVLHYLHVSDEKCLRQIAKRNAERPEGSHPLSVEDFFYVSSYFQAPEIGEGLNIKTYAE